MSGSTPRAGAVPNARRGQKNLLGPLWFRVALVVPVLWAWGDGTGPVAAAVAVAPTQAVSSAPAPQGGGTTSAAVRGGATSASSPASTPQALPTGPGAEVVARRCLSCHEADIISQQRLSEGGWDREIAKMVRWGAVVSDDERPVLLRYLATTFGIRPSVQVAESSATQGARIYQEACLACHAEDLSAQQRLTRAGWIREVEKMMRWGAKVTEEQKGPLADYLTSRWGRP